MSIDGAMYDLVKVSEIKNFPGPFLGTPGKMVKILGFKILSLNSTIEV